MIEGGLRVFDRRLLDLAREELLVEEDILKGKGYPCTIVTCYHSRK